MVMKVFCIFGFENFVERFFGEFSGGQKRFVMIVRMFVQGGEFFFFDEFILFFDFRNQYFVFSVIRKFLKERIVLVLFYDFNQVLIFCDMVFFLKDGGIIVSGELVEVFNEENLMELYRMKVKWFKVDGGFFIYFLEVVG